MEHSNYDAFISFASVDRWFARRIQRFLERWYDVRKHRRLRVFLDETDIRGGALDLELRRAAHASETLIVCHSPAASESRWVAEEVQAFRERRDPNRIAIAIVGGKSAPAEAGRQLIEAVELRVHDLRTGWWLGLLGVGVKLELLRLLAFVAGVEMRTLRNWHLRRMIVRLFSIGIATVLPLALLLNLPFRDWQQLNLAREKEPVFPIAAETNGSVLQIASRYRGAGPQGFRDYIRVVDDALLPQPKGHFDHIMWRRHLLPESLLPVSERNRFPVLDLSVHTDRVRAGERFVGELVGGQKIIVLPLVPTEEELDQARDIAADFGTPIPTVRGAIVATLDGGDTRLAVVEDLSPSWDKADGREGPTSPSHGLAVAWSPEGDVWLGMLAKDAGSRGGLWLRRGGENEWKALPDFVSVQSIDLEVANNRTRSVTVAERHVEIWRGVVLQPVATRVVTRAAGEQHWRAAPAPPFGTRSEVELVGRLQGASLVRVDEQIYRRRSIPLWRFLRDRRARME